MEYKIEQQDSNMAVLRSEEIRMCIVGDSLRWVEIIGSVDFSELYIPHVFPSGHTINKIDGKAFSKLSLSQITRLVIDDSISCIDSMAFMLTYVKEVVWPASCRFIPPCCFKDSCVERVSGIENVQSIAKSAFYHSNITDLNWPENVKIIPDRCFMDCANLSQITGLDNVEIVGQEAFSKCEKLTELTFGNSLKSINRYAFKNCINLTSVHWGNNLESICADAFYDTQLKSISSTNSLKHIGNYAFCQCKIETFDWPKNCTQIKEGTFEWCTALKNINGCENIKSIGQQAFYGCKSLKEFTVPDGVKEIPPLCFSESGLTTINNIEHITKIGIAAFANSAIKGRFKWPDHCRIVEDNVFDNCISLEEVYDLDRVISIGPEAFKNTGISRIDLSHSVCCSVGENAFLGIDSVTLPYFISAKERMV